MEHPVFSRRSGLRIDVDFAFGWQQAVPYMLDELKKHGAHATFFVTCVNAMDRHTSRLASLGYMRRLWNLRVWRLSRLVEGSALREGEVLTGHAATSRARIERIMEEGHEIGLHGYDHRWWSDQVWEASEEELRGDVDRAHAVARELGLAGPLAWAAPAWRTRDEALRLLAEREARYTSDCWGASPFRVRLEDGDVLDMLQLPVTNRSFEHPALIRAPAAAVVDGCIEQLGSDAYSVICAHDYFEGALRRDVFAALLARCQHSGVELCTLSSLACMIEEKAIRVPACSLHRAALEGFPGEVTRQSD